MITIEELRNLLADRNIKVVAENTGLHYNTVYNIATGKTKNPSYNIMITLMKYLRVE